MKIHHKLAPMLRADLMAAPGTQILARVFMRSIYVAGKKTIHNVVDKKEQNFLIKTVAVGAVFQSAPVQSDMCR
jgi:hypothetical protein